MIPMLILPLGAAMAVLLVGFALMGPNTTKAQTRRVESIRARHSGGGAVASQLQLRRIQTNQATRLDAYMIRLLPNPDQLRLRLQRTGRSWTLGRFAMVCAGLQVAVAAAALTKGLPLILALLVGTIVGVGLPHFVVGKLITGRVAKFNAKFPEAIELLVRGLRSGLPITETLTVVGTEVPGPVGVEFRLIGDRIRIGRTMDAAMQETADRLGTPEFQFFTITLSIQRETGGNLAETLSNLADVLRKRAQMKLKIRAMSSESKASAFIVGSLPFFVFVIIYFMNGGYMQRFFVEPRLMVAGCIGLVWMSIGAFIMAKMISFEI